jgi:transposase InsO family protein
MAVPIDGSTHEQAQRPAAPSAGFPAADAAGPPGLDPGQQADLPPTPGQPGDPDAPPPRRTDGNDPPLDGGDVVPPESPAPPLAGRPRGRDRGRRLVPPQPAPAPFSAEQRLLILDSWQRSGLPAGDFAPLVGLSRHTLYAWKKRFDTLGPAGLLDTPKGAPGGSRLPELTRRTILLLKQSHPDWGCQRISDALFRGPAMPASAGAVARVLHEAGYQLEEVATRPHAPAVRHFERARPNQLWQTDLFSFVLKRQNRRAYLVAFLDDHSRFVVGYGLHASQSSALVLEVLRAALTSWSLPEEVLTDNGSQYVTWRGTSAFARELQKHGIKQVVAAPRRPETLGKIERFWGTLWREFLEVAVFVDLGDARRRLGLFIDHYNFQRPHQGIDGAVPADRYFAAAESVRRTLQARVAANALVLARQGVPPAPFYLTGQVGGQAVSVHAAGERLLLQAGDGEPQEIALAPPTAVGSVPEPVCPQGIVTGPDPDEGVGPLPPGVSPLDDGPLGGDLGTRGGQP